MKIKKFLVFIFIIAMIFIGINIEVNADMGPKPSTEITITGIKGEYVVAFATRSASGPHFDYETYKQYGGEESYGLKFNKIMEYSDSDGFKWMSRYYICNGESTISFNYYAPSVFKIVIYKNDTLYRVTDIINTYAYHCYYKMDFSASEIKIKNTYPYLKEILQLLIRIILTLIIEFGLFFLFKLYTKRNIIVIIIVNLITQVGLNVFLNLMSYFNGELSRFILLWLLEFIIFIVEPILYIILLKEKRKWLIFIYGVLANILSFVLGLVML